MKKKIAAAVLLLIIGLFQSSLSLYGQENTDTGVTEPSNLFAKAAVLMDADSGRILFEKNGNDVLPMASTTKIMTCIVALENANTEDIIPVSSYAASMPRVRLGMRSGESYRLKDLLYSLMLESHNDAAVAIAEYVGGSAEGFAALMNQKARDIGCNDTYFITPNGLDATTTITRKSGASEVKTHSTTAKDLAKIMAYCIRFSPQKEAFLEITRTQSYAFHNKKTQEDGTPADGSRSFSCNNHNAFLTMMDGALSGKTGFTGNAGYCYVGALERDGRNYVVALLACGWPNNKGYKWKDTRKLMDYGIDNFTVHCAEEVELEKNILNPLPVIDGRTDQIGETAEMPLVFADLVHKENILLRRDEQISVRYEIKKELHAPVRKGSIVGKVIYDINGDTWEVRNILTADSIEKIDFRWCLEKVLEKFLMS